MDTPWLDDVEQRAWRAFLRTHARVLAQLARELQLASELSLADYDVLVRLTEAPGTALRPAELAERLQWERSRLSHQLNRMERRGLVHKQDHPVDGRGLVIQATDHGMRAIGDAAPGHAAAVRRLFLANIPASELKPLTQTLEGVLDRLDANSAEDPVRDAAAGP